MAHVRHEDAERRVARHLRRARRQCINYPVNGIQNGSPDSFALVDAGGAVVEFLSYEGTMAAADGPAMGLTSTDIGVLENGNGPVGESLARRPDGTWNSSAPNSFGACNDAGDLYTARRGS